MENAIHIPYNYTDKEIPIFVQCDNEIQKQEIPSGFPCIFSSNYFCQTKTSPTKGVQILCNAICEKCTGGGFVFLHNAHYCKNLEIFSKTFVFTFFLRACKINLL